MNMSMEEMKHFYRDLVSMYDVVNDVLNAVEAEPLPANPQDAQKLKSIRLTLAKPVVEAGEKCMDTITHYFMLLAEEGRKATLKEKNEMEKTIRGLFASILQFTELLREAAEYYQRKPL